MKHFYILAVLLSIGIGVYANTVQIRYNVNQANWRWRNNDGSEATASWKADQNKPVSYHSAGEIIRLRVEVINTSSRNSIQCSECIIPYPINMFDSLQFTTDITDESSWKNIGFNNNLPFVLVGSDNYVLQDEPTTPQLSGTNAAFSPGAVMVNDSTLNGTVVSSPGRTEHEWVIKGTSNLKPKTKYYFRQYYPANAEMYDNYTYPSLTTATTLAIQLNTFVVVNEGKRVRLQWSVSPDVKADYTNVQRSTDQQAWATISSLQSSGTNYTAYDNNPPFAGIIYYRLQQYDKDGSFSFSEIRSVKTLPAGKAIVSVSPNPVSGLINFKLENIGVKNIDAILVDMSGRVLLAQVFKNIQAGTFNRLTLSQKIAAGVYMLKLKGDNLSESIKVVVQ